MDYLKKLFHSAKTKLARPKQQILTQEQKLSCCLKSYERYLYKIQNIIKWEEPIESVFSVILVNTLFWFLTYIHWKFYGLLFTLLCSFVIHEAWMEHIWPEIRLPKEKKLEIESEKISLPEGLLTVSEISHYASSIKNALNKHCNRMKYLRATQPPVYCAVVSLGCLIIAGIGTFISGLVLIYLLTMGFMIIPGIIKHFLSPEHKEKLVTIVKSFSCILLPPESSGNFDEYMPESTKENLVLLSQAGDNNDLSTPSTEDSSLGDLMMPGYDESSVDTVESLMLPTIPQDSSEDTDSEAGALRFKSSHFNGDGSSTDEEVSLVRDLVFPDVSDMADSTSSSTTTTTASVIGSGLRQTVAGVLYKTFTGAVTRAGTSGGLRFQAGATDVRAAAPDTTSITSRDNLDSDSEFEIIDSEDADSEKL